MLTGIGSGLVNTLRKMIVMTSDMNIDHADLLYASGAFDDEEDEASYQRWLDSLWVDEMHNEAQVENIMKQENF
jgi:hypothetical protein